MQQRHKEDLLSYDVLEEKIVLLEVPDPFGFGLDTYQETFAILKQLIDEQFNSELFQSLILK